MSGRGQPWSGRGAAAAVGLLMAALALAASSPAWGRAGFSAAVVAGLPPGTQQLESPTVVVNSLGERVLLVAQTPGPCIVNGLSCFNAFSQAAPGMPLEGPQPIGEPLDPAGAFLATHPDGTVTAVWTTERGAIRFADRPPGGPVGPAQIVDTTAGSFGRSRLLHNPAGDLMLAVESSATPAAGILVAMRRADERTFGPLRMIPASTDRRGFAAAISNAGDAVIAWIEPGLAGGRGTVRATSCSINTSICEAPTDFPSTASPELYSLAVAANSAGEFAMSWKQTTSQPTGGEIRVIRGEVAGLRVRSDERLPARASTDVHVAIGDDGVTRILWQKVRGHAKCKCNATIGNLRFVAAASGIAFKHSMRISGPAADEGSSLWLTPSQRALIIWSEKGRVLARLVEPRTGRRRATVRLPAAVTALTFDGKNRPIVLWSRAFALKHKRGTGAEVGATMITEDRQRTLATKRFAAPSYGAVRFDAARAPDGTTAIAVLLGDAPGYMATHVALTSFHS